jgi:hypothetical protein
MPCERYRGALADRAAGGPAPPDVEGHLAACGECRAELETLRRALGLADATLNALLADEPGPGLRDRIRRAVAEGDDRSHGRLTGWRLAWTAALGGAVVVAAVLLAAWHSGARGPREGAVPTAEKRVPPTVPAPRPSAEATRLADDTAGTAVPPDHSPSAQASRAIDSPATTMRRARPSEQPREEPEVLVPAGEAEGLLRFAAELQDRPVAPGSLLLSAPSDPLVESRAIDLVPLELVTLDSPSESLLEEGVRP